MEKFQAMTVKDLRAYMTKKTPDFKPTVREVSSTGKTHQNWKTKTAMLKELSKQMRSNTKSTKGVKPTTKFRIGDVLYTTTWHMIDFYKVDGYTSTGKPRVIILHNIPVSSRSRKTSAGFHLTAKWMPDLSSEGSRAQFNPKITYKKWDGKPVTLKTVHPQ